MTGVLASVTSVAEARIVLEAGADIIDLKNPSAGALGALPLETVRQVVDFVAGRKPVSATVGDLPMHADELCSAVIAMAETEVDIVKIGLFGEKGHEACVRALAAATRRGIKIVAVMFADQKPDFSLLPLLGEAGFYGAMLDTAGKSEGGLRHWMEDIELRHFVRTSKRLGLLTGLAGSLRMPDVKPLLMCESDYLGFRGALCFGDQRKSQLDAERVSVICGSVAQMQHTEHSEGRQDCIA